MFMKGYEAFSFSARAIECVEKAEQAVLPVFSGIMDTVYQNQAKVLRAFGVNGVTAGHMQPSSGYGYNDIARDTLDLLFASSLDAQDALVRPQIVSGTHALSIGLQGLLKSGQTLLSATGKPYDTLERVIGIEPNDGSLIERGIRFAAIELTDNGIDLEALKMHLRSDQSIAVVSIQRSSGYAWRKSLSVAQIAQASALVHAIRPECFVYVDNCYGEFTGIEEPTLAGADLMAGSLIKNPGGGLAPTGGYLCGTKKAIRRVESALTAPGIGRACGSYEASYRPFFQGLFMAPSVVGEALKTAVLFAQAFSSLGYCVLPSAFDARSDIIQAIRFGNREDLLAFCHAIQKASPVDSMAKPEPWAMPGYTHEVVMAAGAFVQGSSIELSADAPLLEPYIGYLQGGLTYAHGRIACVFAVDAMLKRMK